MNDAPINSSPKSTKITINRANKYDPFATEPYNHSIYEQAMWRAVIVQALMDASSNSAKKENLQAKQEALVWLRGNSADFATVCYYAGFEPDFVKMMARKALERNCVWRAAPGSAQAKNSDNIIFNFRQRRQYTQYR
jgi:hypothetical protein